MSHTWREYDPFHRGCERCGLRVFMRHQDGRVRGWQTMNWRGQPGPLVLASEAGGWGACNPPPAPPIPEPVIIEYTGDPDQHPGCERVMHAAGGLGAAAGLVAVTALAPACGVEPTWWELGPARAWHGWTWCPTCFPTQKPHHVPKAGFGWLMQNAVRVSSALAIGARRAARRSPLRYPIPERCCLVCGNEPRRLQVGRVAKGELAGLVLLLCSRCAPRKG